MGIVYQWGGPETGWISQINGKTIAAPEATRYDPMAYAVPGETQNIAESQLRTIQARMAQGLPITALDVPGGMPSAVSQSGAGTAGSILSERTQGIMATYDIQPGETYAEWAGRQNIQQASLGGAILPALAYGAGWLYGLAQDWLGGETQMTMPTTSDLGFVPSGPGVPEPPQALVAKHWRIVVQAKDIGQYWVYYWRLIDGSFVSYNPRTGLWKRWRAVKNIVLPKGRRGPTLKQAARAQSYLDGMYRQIAKKTPLKRGK
jgi:hypothetical protein